MSLDPLLTSRDFDSNGLTSLTPDYRARLVTMANGRVKAIWSERIVNDPRHGYWSSLVICPDGDAALAWVEAQAAGRDYAWDPRA